MFVHIALNYFQALSPELLTDLCNGQFPVMAVHLISYTQFWDDHDKLVISNRCSQVKIDTKYHLVKFVKQKWTAISFKRGWLEEVVETKWTQSECTVRLKIREIFSYSDDSGVVCLVCRDMRRKLLDIFLLDQRSKRIIVNVRPQYKCVLFYSRSVYLGFFFNSKV